MSRWRRGSLGGGSTRRYDLAQSERAVLRQVAAGEVADLRSGNPTADDPTRGDTWGEGRTVRAEFLWALCTGRTAGFERPSEDGPRSAWEVHTHGVRVRGARVAGRLDLSFVELSFPLRLLSCYFEGDEPLDLEGFRAPELALSGSRVPGVNGDGLEVRGDVYLDDGFAARGEVRLVGAKLDGLSCDGGRFANEGGNALLADRIAVDGNVFLNNRFAATGAVRLIGAKVGGQLDCTGGTFANEGGDALNAQAAVVAETFFWRPAATPAGRVDLNHATVGRLQDTFDAWPADAAGARLSNFAYDALPPADPVKERLAWVRRYHGGARYEPQPYEQLAALYRRAGREADARTVAVAKEHERRDGLPRWIGPGHWLFGATAGYGYRLRRPLAALAALVAVGAAVFSQAHAGCDAQPMARAGGATAEEPTAGATEGAPAGATTAQDAPGGPPAGYDRPGCAMRVTSDAPELPVFSPIVYALDVVLPIIDLRQQDFWTPEGPWALRWFWASIVAGWALSSAVVAGLTRALSRE